MRVQNDDDAIELAYQLGLEPATTQMGAIFGSLCKAKAEAAALDAWEAGETTEAEAQTEPTAPGCIVLLFGLGLVAFEALVRWLA